MTLVEIMVSLVILGFGLLGVAALQVRAITESSGGQHLSTASAIARNRVEELSRLAWDAAVLVDSAGAWSADTPIPVADQTYGRAERITDVVGADIKSIEVRVSWSDEKRQNRSVVLASARLKEVDE
jgi:Tfp pilus assembly protein PilV